MAKKISSKDLFESEDIFKGIRDSAEKTLLSLNKINDEFKQTAATLKQSLGDAKFDSSDSIKKFTQATAEANKIQKQSIEIQKLQEQVKQQAIKSEKEQERLAQERIKTQKAESQEKSRLAAESAKQVKAAENEASAYAKLSKDLNNARKAYKDLAVQNKENTAEGQQLLKQVTDLDNQLKKVDATVGQHQRNVGNYEGATKNLKTELRALTKELMNMSESDPKFQEMAQKAGELKDQIQDTQAVVKATAGSAMENFAGSVAKAGQVGIAAFQGMESSMVLLGIENENILASMQKLQALAGLGDALKTLGGLGDALTEIRAGFTATLAKMGLLTTAKQADTVATVENTVATTAQATATTATTGATKLLGNAMKMLPIVAIAAAIGAIIYGLAKWATAAGELSAKQKALNESFGAYKKAAIDATAVTIKVGTAFNEAKKGVISKEKALKIYNDSLGATFGTATSLNEAEKMFAANTKNYVEASALRAQADTLIQMSAEKRIALIYEEEAAHALAAKAKPEDRYNIITMASEGARKKAEQTKKEIAAIDTLIGELSGKASGLESKFQVSPISKSTINSFKDTATEITDLRRSIEDEQIKAIADEDQRQQTQLIIEAQRRIEDTEKTVADKKEKAKLIEEIENNLMIELDKIDEAYWNKKAAEEKERLAKEKEDADKRLADEKTRKENILNQEEEFLNQYQQAINTDKQNEINSVREKYFTMIEMAKQHGLDTKVLEEKLRKELLGIDDKYNKSDEEKTKETAEKRQETIEQFANKTAEYFKKKSDEKIKSIDAEMAAAQKQGDALKELAANGNINAQQSLAENQRIIDQANLKKEKELKKQKRIEAGLAIFKLFSANADKKNPLAATIKDTTGLLAFISSLPAFYDGTEDTGANGKGIDGKGGFHAVLHPNERVVPKSLNEQIGSMSNEQLTKIAQEYQNGRLIAKSNANSGLEMAILVNEMRDLKEVIKNKPETNIALGEITQSAMNIVESKRTGNTTIYNRFRISK